MKRYIKLCDYAKNYSVTYRTAWNRFNAGKIPNSFKNNDGQILIEVINERDIDLTKVAIYARVSKRLVVELMIIEKDSENATNI